MKREEINNIIKIQKDFFSQGRTLNLKFRRNALMKLKEAIKRNEKEIEKALLLDLGKSASESYMCEIGLTLSEISYMLKHLKRFSSEKTVKTPLANFLSRSYIKPVPYGNVLIMSPWNYPFMLAMEPLVDAIAAGNTAIVKPAAYSAHTSEIIARIIKECFSEEYVCVVTGGREENRALLEGDFKYIFFTGSKGVGKEVLKKAAEKLIPVTLELGGKSPCIVDETANISLAAKRIVFGKFLNCGQTCVAPDYILCKEEIKEKLIYELKKQIKLQFGDNPLENKDYGKIINERHFNRIISLADKCKVVYGGSFDREKLKIEPTVMDGVTCEDPVMQEEIFGPILPVLTYNSTEEIAERINSGDTPLALYIFSTDKKNIKKITSSIQYGGGCINDAVVHLATSEMGFGGVGESGMGSYHGKTGFDTFSHYKSILDKKNIIDLPVRYQPYKKLWDKAIKLFLR